MTDESAKKLAISTARRWFLAAMAPSLDQAITTVTLFDHAEESPSWQDVDFDSMVMVDGILHIDIKLKPQPPIEWISIDFDT